jgi:hypothetical protein
MLVGTMDQIGRRIEMKHMWVWVTRKYDVQVDALMGAAKEGGHFRKLFNVHTYPRQTILVSVNIP